MALMQALDVTASSSRRRLDRAGGRLVGSRCDECGTTSWPMRAVCHRCGAAPMREEEFAATGSLLTHTTVWVSRPGLEAPYVLGQVKLDDGPLVFGHIREMPSDLRVPATVRLACAADEAAIPPFWFEPEVQEA